MPSLPVGCRGSLDQSLKEMLRKFSAEKRFTYWSSYVKSLAFHVAETEGVSGASITEYQMMISAWRMMLIVSASHVRTSGSFRDLPPKMFKEIGEELKAPCRRLNRITLDGWLLFRGSFKQVSLVRVLKARLKGIN